KEYGDRAGDIALQAIASGLQAAARSTDLVYRKGGEEFVVILPHTDFAVAWAVAERMREKIAQLDIVHAEGGPDKKVSVLVSVGVVRPGGAVASAVVASGDEAMRAKEAGRRGSVVGSP
ncbi:MAG: diguanylate cyclase, partial [Burkholderiaceae bacterium]|nr:diguanylate cyclase [Burkholderiaceae bacterium]